MKTLRRGISYNLACSILEANHYFVDKVLSISHNDYFMYVFKDRTGRTVARYNEKYGTLQVITN